MLPMIPTDEERAAGAADLPGTCHFPKYSEDYFMQLTAERLVTHHQRGALRREWQSDPSRRNEALDCRVYARAAAELFGLSRFTPRHWRQVERARAGSVSPSRAVSEPPAPTPPAPGRGRGVRGRFRV